MLCREDLHEYQRRGVDMILSRKRAFMMLDLGLGKTITTLTALSDLHDSLSVNKTLIIAPLRVANSVWKQEAQNWKHTKHLKINVATGSEKQRISALSDSAEIIVINRENIKWLVMFYGKKWPFDCVIVDESSSFKSSKSQRFKALKHILPKTDYMVLLTGTPSPNGLLDLWAQCYLIDYGHSLGRTMTCYKQRFFDADYMGYKLTPKNGVDEEIHKLIAPFSMSMKAEDYLQLPPRIDSTVKIQLKPAVLKKYRDFEKDLFLEFDDIELEAQSAATLANKLLQWCNGAIYTDEHKNWSTIHDDKLDALTDIIDDNPGENILVAYNYKSDLERLKQQFPHAVTLDKNPQTIKDWNEGKIKLLLAHPASAGHGLNLQKGGSVIVWFGLNWSLELYQQFNGRLHRQGQLKPVRIIHIVVEECLDERVMNVLAIKDLTQEKLISALKYKTV